jgi:TetR/AcrR family transcriptional regulator
MARRPTNPSRTPRSRRGPAGSSAARGPGRPPAAQARDSRQALIDAARDQFSRHAFEEVSVKQLAEQAGLNPAMIQYHFGGKTELLECAFREALAPVVAELGTLEVDDATSGPRLRGFFALYMRTLAANPWLPKMMVRHVLPDGGLLQAQATELIGRRVGPVIAALLRQDQEAGRLRPDLDPLLTTLSIVALAVFPFVSLPVTQRVFGLRPDAAFVERLIDHTTGLFYHGAASHESV